MLEVNRAEDEDLPARSCHTIAGLFAEHAAVTNICISQFWIILDNFG